MIRQLEQHGIELPQDLAQPPELSAGLEWYLEAWQELSHDRQIGFGLGPIPGSAIRAFAEYHRLDDTERDDLMHLIRRLDQVFLEHSAEQAPERD